MGELSLGQRERIRAIFCEVMGLAPATVSDDTSYESCEPWDSLKHMEMVARFEEDFGLDLEIDDVIEMSSMGKITEILARYLRSAE